MSTGSYIGRVAKQTLDEYISDDGLRLSASLAFYSVLSLAPTLIFALALAGILWDTAPARAEVARYLTELAGAQAAEFMLTVMENSSESGSAGLATVLGFVVLVFGATAAFAELQSGLNMVWKVEEADQIRGFVRRRIVSAAIIFAIAMLLMLSVAIAALVGLLASFVRSTSPLGDGVWLLLQHLGSLALFTGFFAAIFKLLPSTSITWRKVWGGALFTSLLFVLGQYLIRLYLAKASLTSSYGAAGSVIAFLLWIYYSAIIFYLGAELTSVLSRVGRQPSGRARASSGDGDNSPDSEFVD